VEDLNCKNCGTPISDKFCQSCGQRYLRTPYSKEIILFLASQTFDFSANYFRTIWTLLIKPNQVVSTFLSGNVKKYLNPWKYLVLTVAVLLVFDWLEAFISNESGGASENMELPLYGILGTAILYIIIMQKLFWKSFSWIEHLIISIYLAIQMLAMSVFVFWIFSWVFKIVDFDSSGAEMFSYSLILMVIYYFYYMISIFTKSKVLSFIKSVFILLIGYFIVILGYGWLS
jgi:hypothetical protein